MNECVVDQLCCFLHVDSSEELSKQSCMSTFLPRIDFINMWLNGESGNSYCRNGGETEGRNWDNGRGVNRETKRSFWKSATTDFVSDSSGMINFLSLVLFLFIFPLNF